MIFEIILLTTQLAISIVQTVLGLSVMAVLFVLGALYNNNRIIHRLTLMFLFNKRNRVDSAYKNVELTYEMFDTIPSDFNTLYNIPYGELSWSQKTEVLTRTDVGLLFQIWNPDFLNAYAIQVIPRIFAVMKVANGDEIAAVCHEIIVTEYNYYKQFGKPRLPRFHVRFDNFFMFVTDLIALSIQFGTWKDRRNTYVKRNDNDYLYPN